MPVAFAGIHHATLDHLESIGKYERVQQGKSSVSNGPMASFGYVGCRAIVLRSGPFMGLSHIHAWDDVSSSGEDGQHYVDEMLKHFREKGTDTRNLAAITVCGMDPDLIERTCYVNGIKLVDGFYEHPYYSGSKAPRSRDIVVLPSTREVFVYGNFGKHVMTF